MWLPAGAALVRLADERAARAVAADRAPQHPAATPDTAAGDRPAALATFESRLRGAARAHRLRLTMIEPIAAQNGATLALRIAGGGPPDAMLGFVSDIEHDPSLIRFRDSVMVADEERGLLQIRGKVDTVWIRQ